MLWAEQVGRNGSDKSDFKRTMKGWKLSQMRFCRMKREKRDGEFSLVGHLSDKDGRNEYERGSISKKNIMLK